MNDANEKAFLERARHFAEAMQRGRTPTLDDWRKNEQAERYANRKSRKTASTKRKS